MKNCPVCGSEDLVEVVGPEEFKYEGHSVVVPDYRSFECQRCGESFASEESMKRSEPLLCDLHRRAERLLTSAEIRHVRESLGFSQDKFGELLGGGKKAFARYENGKVTQARAMDNLLRVLKAFPQALSELQGETGSPSTLDTASYQVRSVVCFAPASRQGYIVRSDLVHSNLDMGVAA